jgi:hypothetical protein
MASLGGVIVAIRSFFDYLQNLSVTVNLPDIHFPAVIRNFFEWVNQFLRFIFMLLPGIPPFDLRAQLVIVSFILPLILSITFVWFVTPFRNSVSQIVDIAVAIALSMSVVQGVHIVGDRLPARHGPWWLLFRHPGDHACCEVQTLELDA